MFIGRDHGNWSSKLVYEYNCVSQDLIRLIWYNETERLDLGPESNWEWTKFNQLKIFANLHVCSSQCSHLSWKWIITTRQYGLRWFPPIWKFIFPMSKSPNFCQSFPSSFPLPRNKSPFAPKVILTPKLTFMFGALDWGRFGYQEMYFYVGK